MTNRELLRDAISSRGLRMKYLAERIGITPQAFSSKMVGKSEFTLYEVGVLRTIMSLSAEETDAIFFGNAEA